MKKTAFINKEKMKIANGGEDWDQNNNFVNSVTINALRQIKKGGKGGGDKGAIICFKCGKKG